MQGEPGQLSGENSMAGNSPDLNPIENLWGYLQQDWTRSTQQNYFIPKIQLKSAWASLQPSFLQALVNGMPERVKTCTELDGNYISK